MVETDGATNGTEFQSLSVDEKKECRMCVSFELGDLKLVRVPSGAVIAGLDRQQGHLLPVVAGLPLSPTLHIRTEHPHGTGTYAEAE